MEEAIKTTRMTGREATSTRILEWLRNSYGALLERFHAPAKIKEFECIDPLTNETVYLSTGARYSVLHVGNRRFFFDRTTGRFDGTGSLLQQNVLAPNLSPATSSHRR